MEKTQDYNLSLLNEYLSHLKEKYKKLEQEPFSVKARLVLRREIENTLSALAEQDCDKIWDSLDAVFGAGNKKPDNVYNSYPTEDWGSKFDEASNKSIELI